MFREFARDAATAAAGQEDDEDAMTEYAGADRMLARAYRAIADALDPREEGVEPSAAESRSLNGRDAP